MTAPKKKSFHKPLPHHSNQIKGRSKSGTFRKPKSSLPLISALVLAIISGIIIFLLYNFSQPSEKASANNLPLTATPINLSQPFTEDGVVAYTQKLIFSSDTTLPLAGKVIILDPGHGGQDTGAVYPAENPVYEEAVYNLKIAQATQKELEKQGATVVLLRKDNSWLSLYNRLALTHLYALQYANQTGQNPFSEEKTAELVKELMVSIKINTDTQESGGMGIMAGTGVGEQLEELFSLEKELKDMIFLSIHINANDDSQYHGSQMYYVTDDSIISSEASLVQNDPQYQDSPYFPLRSPYYGRDNEANQKLAQCLIDAATAVNPDLITNMPRSIQADNYAVLREQNLVSVLVETAFLSNSQDRNYLTQDAAPEELAQGITQGCIEYFS